MGSNPIGAAIVRGKMQVYTYWFWKKTLPHEICQKLTTLGEGNWKQAQTQESREDNKLLDNVRKSDIVWIKEQWVYDLITPYMLSANEQAGWKYDMVATESCQVTRYTKDGFYKWHKDGMGSHHEIINDPNNKGNVRKLSMSVFLNDNYEGGNVEIVDEDKVPRLEEGSIIVFPSFLEHRVAPVTKGTRYSLVAWFLGPPFV